jgi:hypothetical protein
MSLEGSDVVKWRERKRVRRKEVVVVVVRGCIVGGIRRGCAAAGGMVGKVKRVVLVMGEWLCRT